jgi:hypothetical protein
MKAADWHRVFDVAGSIIAASQDVGAKQAIVLALKLYDLFQNEPVEDDDDEASEPE